MKNYLTNIKIYTILGTSLYQTISSMSLLIFVIKFYLFAIISGFFDNSWCILWFEFYSILIYGFIVVAISAKYPCYKFKKDFARSCKPSIHAYVGSLVCGILLSLFNYILISLNIIQIQDVETFLFISTVFILFNTMLLDMMFNFIKNYVMDTF
jgi:hypothetical protein